MISPAKSGQAAAEDGVDDDAVRLTGSHRPMWPSGVAGQSGGLHGQLGADPDALAAWR
jgi:hypothetical protein